MRRRPALTASRLAFLLAFAAPLLTARLEPPASRATPSIQPLASPRTVAPIGAGIDASLQLGCAPLQPREPSRVIYAPGWKRAAAGRPQSSVCGKPAGWRT